MNADLFNQMALPECYRQCAQTHLDALTTFEMEQVYKCMITYKQTLQLVREIDRQ